MPIVKRKVERRIGRFTLKEWEEFARCDDCLDRMVPSELRMLIAAIPTDDMKKELEFLRDQGGHI